MRNFAKESQNSPTRPPLASGGLGLRPQTPSAIHPLAENTLFRTIFGSIGPPFSKFLRTPLMLTTFKLIYIGMIN